MNIISSEKQIERLQWLSGNEFILKPNYEWHHIREKAMVKQSLLETATDEEWDRLCESFEWYFDNQ